MFAKPFFTAATRCLLSLLLSLLLLSFLFVYVRLGLGTGHMDALSHRTHIYHYIALYYTRPKHVWQHPTGTVSRFSIQTSKSILIEELLLLLVLFRILNRKVTMDLFSRGSLSKINPGSFKIVLVISSLLY